MQLNRWLNPIRRGITTFRRVNELDEREQHRIKTLVSALNRAQKIRRSADIDDANERTLSGCEQTHNNFWKNRPFPRALAEGLFQVTRVIGNAIGLTAKEVLAQLQPLN